MRPAGGKPCRECGLDHIQFVPCAEARRRRKLQLARKVLDKWRRFVQKRESRRRDGVDVNGRRDRRGRPLPLNPSIQLGRLTPPPPAKKNKTTQTEDQPLPDGYYPRCSDSTPIDCCSLAGRCTWCSTPYCSWEVHCEHCKRTLVKLGRTTASKASRPTRQSGRARTAPPRISRLFLLVRILFCITQPAGPPLLTTHL